MRDKFWNNILGDSCSLDEDFISNQEGALTFAM